MEKDINIKWIFYCIFFWTIFDFAFSTKSVKIFDQVSEGLFNIPLCDMPGNKRMRRTTIYDKNKLFTAFPNQARNANPKIVKLKYWNILLLSDEVKRIWGELFRPNEHINVSFIYAFISIMITILTNWFI